MKKQPMIILDEHPDWLTPLYEDLRQKGIAFEKMDISSASYNPDSRSVLPFYVNRLSPSAQKRAHATALNYTYNYLEYLESNGARVVNGSHTVLLETSKALQTSLMRRLGISHPRTIVLNNFSQLKEHVKDFKFPVVIKPNCGGSGMGIQKFAGVQELLDAADDSQLNMPPEQLVLLQEFIQPQEGYIVRVEIIGGEIAYAMKVFTKDTFNLCPSESCDLTRDASPLSTTEESLGYCVATPTTDVRFELLDQVPIEIEQSIKKLVKSAGLEAAGVEYVVGEDHNWYIYDINALSILRATFKEEYGIDGWGMLANYFIAEYEKCFV